MGLADHAPLLDILVVARVPEEFCPVYFLKLLHAIDNMLVREEMFVVWKGFQPNIELFYDASICSSTAFENFFN